MISIPSLFIILMVYKSWSYCVTEENLYKSIKAENLRVLANILILYQEVTILSICITLTK